MKNDISVIITTYNEEKNIIDCIKSAFLLTHNIIVVDTESTDNTRRIAGKLGVNVYTYPYKGFVEPVRDFAIQKVETTWLFILDADERITPELAEEIKKSMWDTEATHFKIPRKNIFAHRKWLKHGGWYPDYVMRLMQKKAYKSWPDSIHSTPLISGKQDCLNNPLIHYFHPDMESVVKKTAVFEDKESDLLFKAGKTVTTKTFFRKFFGELNRRLVVQKGFLDGPYGVIESFYQAYSKTVTYLLLYEKRKRKSTSL